MQKLKNYRPPVMEEGTMETSYILCNSVLYGNPGGAGYIDEDNYYNGGDF